MKAKQHALPAVLACVVLFVLWSGEPGDALEVTPVEVVNLPETQTVDGEVTVDQPVPHSRFLRVERVIVPPVDRGETTSLEAAGLIETDGFTHAVVSIRGESQGKLGREGAIGAVLLPDEEAVLRTFREAGRFEFALSAEAVAHLQDRGYFAGASSRQTIAFPRYRLLLFNETDRSAEVDLYVYLTH